ncbi:bifunctional 2',3'-cyclic-nucleotide 2'-phosphodiesterase/3'-nucleotidase [Paenisporosarcina cavernae]|uniref:Bifunctional 2',3'-cyclic-nucleotide 2'-phosphodiesterase/3'-nucleotidase n=1 Tax=Paenisporosarcina cavernae TaxID=2320858 RepID=A0A385YXW7_9BACL|nr:bifunctional 2',3'-cyclic-nucleotide 2'-phosphodiesterase/3'-nucleotidase [Paenisporosarcina cavernae]
MWKKVTASALAVGLITSSAGMNAGAAGKAPSVTRGEFVKSLISGLDVSLGNGSTVTFKDVDKSLAPYVEKAVELGLVNGLSASEFGTNNTLRREQAFAIAARGIDTQKSYPVSNLKQFKDVNHMSHSLLPDMAKGVGIGLLLGYADHTVKPQRVVSPGEMRSIVQRFLKEYSPSQANTSVALRIMGTSDIHTNIMAYDYYKDMPSNSLGLAKTATLIKNARKENPNNLLVDNGDLIQGTPLGSYKAIVPTGKLKDGEEHPSVKVLELLGYDAATAGNHEFNYGLDYLDEVLDDVDYEYVNANVKKASTGENYFKPYTVMTKKMKDSKGNEVSVKVGITGIVPPDILKWDKSHLEGKVTVQDSVDAVEAVIPKMKAEGADVILVLSHSGMGDAVHTDGEEDVTYLLTKVEGVDAIVTGHAHAVFPGAYKDLPGVDTENGTINGVPVVMPGKFGSHLGVIDLTLAKKGSKWNVTNSHAEVRAIVKEDASDVDASVVEAVKAAHEGTLAYVREAVGTITSDIHSYFALVQDDPSIQIVTDAQKQYVEGKIAGTEYADLPVLSAGAPFKAGTRGDAEYFTFVPKGEIAIKNVADLYLYDNTLAALVVTGADVKEWLEMSAGQFNQIDPTATGEQSLINTDFRTYNFDVIDGVTYKIDVTQPAKYDVDGNVVNEDASRITDLMYDGKPIDLTQKFVVATNNYRANGKFPGVRNKSAVIMYPDENRQAVVDYIAGRTIDPSADGNWSFATLPASASVVFESSPSAKAFVPVTGNIAYVGEGTDGFAKYSLK